MQLLTMTLSMNESGLKVSSSATCLVDLAGGEARMWSASEARKSTRVYLRLDQDPLLSNDQPLCATHTLTFLFSTKMRRQHALFDFTWHTKICSEAKTVATTYRQHIHKGNTTRCRERFLRAQAEAPAAAGEEEFMGVQEEHGWAFLALPTPLYPVTPSSLDRKSIDEAHACWVHDLQTI